MTMMTMTTIVTRRPHKRLTNPERIATPKRNPKTTTMMTMTRTVMSSLMRAPSRISPNPMCECDDPSDPPSKTPISPPLFVGLGSNPNKYPSQANPCASVREKKKRDNERDREFNSLN
uniref:(northern house mosquito) hypothetical protein n=1 Tax=Culex pipiens TaxID=7175 RepID=A0A8D8CUS0_CULPI